MITDWPDKVDAEDAVLGPLAVVSAAVSTGFASFSAAGYGFASQAFSTGGVSLTIAGAGALVAFLIAWITNDRSFSDFESRGSGQDSAKFIVLAAPALLAGVELSSQLATTVGDNVWVAATVTLAYSAAFYAVAHY